MNSPHVDIQKSGFQDFFLHPTIRKNPDLQYRARILALSILALMLVSIGTLFGVSFIPSLASLRIATLPANAISICVLVCSLYGLKYRGAYKLCCYIVVIFSFLSITIGGILTGGPSYSPAFQLLVVPSILAYFFGGLRWGVTTATTSLAVIVILQVADMAGLRFLRIIIEPQAQKFVLLINLPTVAGLALIYEMMTITLKKSRDLQHRQYAQLAITDPLTGLPNRRIFSETLAARIALYGSMVPPRRFALCYLDLDRFKPINDQLGHGVGDEVLREVSDKLRLALRGADFIGRIGGDEFMILLGETCDAASIDALAMRYLKLIREPIKTSAGYVELDGSLGFAIFPDHGASALSLEKAADIAMYEAKKSRLGYLLYTPALPNR